MNYGVEVIGRACRLPGANSVAEFWDLLASEQCSVKEIGEDRFSTFRYLHPSSGREGKAYTFRAGTLDDVWGFDPAPFLLSPREAAQMDPQQRLLLMLVWEALEEAGMPPSEVAGQDIGVFVGNSGSDHSNRFFFDPASSDSFMMTGNTMSLVSNRISYIFDLHGPSFTVDTACSSSLVALDLALKRLKSGEIDTAIVAGVNMLLSPFPFVGFSAASMLSPEGLCRPFDINANGYVRAEGAVALVLKRSDCFDAQSQTSYGRIVASGINSDGRTSGVALPSAEYQATLLKSVYEDAGVSADQLAFVEAHGTGTRVGDPAETWALGKVLGQKRATPLPIGSVKSNIGHLEPASGLASILKSLLALEKGILPASLHIETPNPDIDFDDLNLELNKKTTKLSDHDGQRFAGINNFGFGGTNAHVLVSEAEPTGLTDSSGSATVSAQTRAADTEAQEIDGRSRLLVLSARNDDALRAMASQSADLIDDNPDLDLESWSNQIAWHRELMSERLALIGRDSAEIKAGLRNFASEKPVANAALSSGAGQPQNPYFVFSGNGSQFAGMGSEAYARNASFAKTFDRVDAIFEPLAGWSLVEALSDEDLKERLISTSVAQPLLFAIQVALTESLRDAGVECGGVIGHSVGEVAAAWACGALDLEDAVKVIYARSFHQEKMRGKGRMAVIKLTPEAAEEFIATEGFDDIEISAINTPQSLTLSGPEEDLRSLLAIARKRKLPAKLLDIDYPFHSVVIDPIRDGLVSDLAAIESRTPNCTFISTVTAREIVDNELVSEYWWNNVRQPVRFYEAVDAAIEAGQTAFVEIGPRPILKGYVNEIARDKTGTISVVESLDQKSSKEIDPVLLALGRVIANGMAFNRDKAFGPKQKMSLPLPNYPWQLKPYKLEPSREAFEVFTTSTAPHPLLGQQMRSGDLIWDTELDSAILPYLRDHKVDGKVILPGAAFTEMALAAVQQWLGSDQVELRDMDLIQAMVLEEDSSLSVRTRIDADARTIEISSRRRLVEDEWQLHARSRIAKVPGESALENTAYDLNAPNPTVFSTEEDIETLYETSREFGLDFGPLFQRMVHCERFGDDYIEVVLKKREEPENRRELNAANYCLHPLDFDGTFHGLNTLYRSMDEGDDKVAFIPVRFGTLRILRSGVEVRSARIHVLRSNNRGIQADIDLFADDGSLVATLRDGRFRASALVQRLGLDQLTYSYDYQRLALPAAGAVEIGAAADVKTLHATAPAGSQRGLVDDGQMLLQAASRRGAYDILHAFADDELTVNIDDLPALKPMPELADEIAQEDLRARQTHRIQLMHALLDICEQSGFAELSDGTWSLSEDCGLPPVSDLLQMLLKEDARWAADIVMLNHAILRMPEALKTMPRPHGESANWLDLYSHALIEQHFSSSPLATCHVEQTLTSLQAIMEAWPNGKPLRILELGIGGGSLAKKLVPLVAEKRGLLVAADSNKTALDRLRIQFSDSHSVETAVVEGDLEPLEAFGPFDLVVSANGLPYLSKAVDLVSKLPGLLSQNGKVIVSLSDANAFHDVTFGMAGDWFASSVDPSFPIAHLGHSESWQALFNDSGLSDVVIEPFVGEDGEADLSGAWMLSARKASAQIAVAAQSPDSLELSEAGDAPKSALSNGHSHSDRHCLIITSDDGEQPSAFVDALQAALSYQSTAIEFVLREPVNNDGMWTPLVEKVQSNSSTTTTDLIYVSQAPDNATEPMQTTSVRAHELAALLRATAELKVRIWIVAPGGSPLQIGADIVAEQAAIWGLGRTAMNEYGGQDIRLVDFDPDLSALIMAQRLADLFDKPGDECEILLEQHAIRAVRMSRKDSEHVQAESEARKGAATVLHHPRSGSFDRMQWRPTARKAPAEGEIQIEVAATGLNFRDVMWAQGLLPEEALEDGFAGPTLGFECSGRVSAVGKGVKRFKVGEPVMALAPAAFGSHVTVEETGVSKLPSEMDLTAAASLPVAFLTSYYALHHLAELEENEWVLIHGAAGAVGLAAVQIAKWRGARIIATAGDDAKRDFLKMLGADHVLNTRSLDFVDQVRAITRDTDGPGNEGVDVVLNSLFGEAMERSLELVRPFGRFLELGKRDFYGNSKIGLRPFRRNITYYGIDADQLLNRKPKRAKRLFAEMAQLFEAGEFSILPYRLFESGDIVDAFRLMQQSGHIGKIVVKAPPVQSGLAEANGFEVDQNGTHLVIGGLGGFGVEVARWLADKGATSIVLTSRSGKPGDETKALIKKLAETGCHVEPKACDVTDSKALEALLADLRKSRPIKGVIHSAMVLEDALIMNLDNEQIDKVFAPKIRGGDNLDKLTRTDELDYFWLFSSISVLIGNPGQAHYVAANAYLDGLARKRRAEGLPALAIGWGPITDVGILARENATAETLAKTTGGMDFKARFALEKLEEFLKSKPAAQHPATISIAPMSWSFAASNLPVMKLPSFAMLAREAATSSGFAEQAIDVKALIEGLSDIEARDKIAALLAEQVASIFRMPVDEVNLKRALSDLGMDSLMGMELRTTAQQKLDIEIPMAAIADGTTINDIAASVLERVRAGEESKLSSTEEMLLHQHVGSEAEIATATKSL